MRILVAEDDAHSQTIMAKYLQPLGDVTMCWDGVEALEAFDQAIQSNSGFDLICLDIMMPELDGQKTLAKIRELEDENNIETRSRSKVVMVSALDDPHSVMEAYYHGLADGYLVKPIQKIALYEKLTDLGFELDNDESDHDNAKFI